ncbi:ABC transporter permease [Nonomuraea roseoviolacea]|uniref:ABC transport system permease protein n=1 Tax=Nonomuraea roseoviolacea subsp. carminata TaxID=160689 RepID=A0ABT1K092_9ACTN|nr:FtsX-like permease family protein [Nonomuraea roseoviolacea]MCP2347405.1 putative ABC transport system permease protein [Nonomuraea roseoviolacea subsp. carminata]
MLTIALATLRTRWMSFVGTFAALALGAALIAALGQVLATTTGSPDRGPQRYAAAPVVVVPDDRLTVPTWQGGSSAPLAEPRGVPAGLAGRLPGAVEDRAFPAQLAGGPPAVGRPWSAARTAPHRLVSGRAPATAHEIAVTGGAPTTAHGIAVTGGAPATTRDGAAAGEIPAATHEATVTAGGGERVAAAAVPGPRIGEQVSVVTAAGARPYTVVGITSPGPEATVFFSDAQAARLSPRITALAVWKDAAEVEAAVKAAGGKARILTGQNRALADPSRAADENARDNANTIVGIAAGFAGFIAVFVVSSTFAFAVGQRRREFALLRTIGATTPQVRRMVYGEALLVAVTASATGALLGPLGARPIQDWLVSLGMAPAWLVPSTSSAPSWIAFGTGVVVAVLGVVLSARRAGRVPPAEALRESGVEQGAMTPGRWVAGLAVLATALVSMTMTAVGDPSSATGNKSYMPVLMLLIAAVGLLAPVVVRPVTRLLTWPVERLRGAGGTVVAAGAVASARQTAATAAPVLVTVGLAASLLGAAAMSDAAKTAMEAGPIRADHVVLPTGPAGLDRQLVRRLRDLPGADVTTVTPTSVYTLEGRTALIRRPAEAVDPGALRQSVDVPVVAGSLAGLRDDTIAVSETWDLGVGQSVTMWRADGSEATFTVTAVLGSRSAADSYVTPAHAFSALPYRAYVKLRPGAAADQVAAALQRATRGHNARALTKAAWERQLGTGRASASRLGLLVVLGIMLAYTAIALVNTLLMAASDRSAERGALRLLGATRGQVLRYVMGEALLVVAVGTVLAALATALSLLGLWTALVQLTGLIPGTLPWGTIAAVTGGCAVLAVLAAVIPALASKDIRPTTA